MSNTDFLRMMCNERRKAQGKEELDPLEFYGFLTPKLEQLNMDPSFLVGHTCRARRRRRRAPPLPSTQRSFGPLVHSSVHSSVDSSIPSFLRFARSTRDAVQLNRGTETLLYARQTDICARERRRLLPSETMGPVKGFHFGLARVSWS